MSYAWIIDKDHLNGPGGEFENKDNDEAGVIGPRDAPDNFVEVLQGSAGGFSDMVSTYTFKMYDDDDILYYSGRLICENPPDEESCYGPLGDYGLPNAGAVTIKYDGHPEMDCS